MFPFDKLKRIDSIQLTFRFRFEMFIFCENTWLSWSNMNIFILFPKFSIKINSMLA